MSGTPYSHTELSEASLGCDFRDTQFVKSVLGYVPEAYTGPERIDALSRIATGVKFERQKREAYLTRYLYGVGPEGRSRFFGEALETEFTIEHSFKTFAKDALEIIIPKRLAHPIYFERPKGISAELVHQNQLGNWDTAVLDTDMRALEQSSVLPEIQASFVERYSPQHPKTSYKWHYVKTPEGTPLLICDRVRPEADYTVDGTRVEIIKRSSFFVLLDDSHTGKTLDLLGTVTSDETPNQEIQTEVGARIIEPAIMRFKRSGEVDPTIFPIEALFFAMIRHRSGHTAK